MDLKDQLKNLFPEHTETPEAVVKETKTTIWMQDSPIICKYEKRKGKPITIIEGYTGADKDFKALAKDLKKKLSVASVRYGIHNKYSFARNGSSQYPSG